MLNIDAIKCANDLADSGLKFVGSTNTLSYFITHRMTESRMFDLERYYLRFDGDLKTTPAPRILKEYRRYIYDYRDYKDLIKAFLKREYNVRMNEEECTDNVKHI